MIRTTTSLSVALALMAAALNVHAAPTVFTYQGRVTNNGTNFTGTGQFKFALATNNVSLWNSDGNGGSGQPTTAVSVPVTNGLFTVALGDTSLLNMAAVDSSLFLTPNLQLRIWFNDGVNGFAELTPAQKLTATPYAGYATAAGGLNGSLPATQISGTVSAASTATTAGSFTNSLAGDVTGTQSATVVSKVGGQTAVNVANGISAVNAATSANTANTIVRRDGNGSFTNGSLTLSSNLTLAGNMYLPTTTTNTGVIYSGTDRLIHTYGPGSFFAGRFAGNLSVSGLDNTAVGTYALFDNTSGSYNTALGYSALANNTNSSYNTAIGFDALYSNSGSHNTAVGSLALIVNSSGIYNTAIGASALYANTVGYYNVAIGSGALDSLTTGSQNIAVGDSAGQTITTGQWNIDIGNQGVASDSFTIRIGDINNHSKCFIAGIAGATASPGAVVYVNANTGQLGTITSSARFKTNILDMAEASDGLLALRPVTFNYKPEIDPDATPQFGLIAEEVEKVNPALVIYDKTGQPYTVRYEAVNAMLLNEFLKEHRTVEAQAAEIQDLKARLEKIEKLIVK